MHGRKNIKLSPSCLVCIFILFLLTNFPSRLLLLLLFYQQMKRSSISLLLQLLLLFLSSYFSSSLLFIPGYQQLQSSSTPVSPLIDQHLCSTLCLSTHILVYSPTRFGVYGQSSCNSVATHQMTTITHQLSHKHKRSKHILL